MTPLAVIIVWSVIGALLFDKYISSMTFEAHCQRSQWWWPIIIALPCGPVAILIVLAVSVWLIATSVKD